MLFDLLHKIRTLPLHVLVFYCLRCIPLIDMATLFDPEFLDLVRKSSSGSRIRQTYQQLHYQ